MRVTQLHLVFLSSLALLATGADALAAESTKEFSKPVIDIGIVVRDIDKSAQFYTNAIGFKEVNGFPVTGDLGRKIGLIDNHPTKVRVFVLDDGDLATRIKLLSFPEAPGQVADRRFIHTTLGINYLTLYVTSTDKVLERLKRAGVKTIGETPVALNPSTRLTAVKDPDGNFIELIGP